MITLACGHSLESSAHIGDLVFCPICRNEAEVREVSASPPRTAVYGSFRDNAARIDILHDRDGRFGFAVWVLGVRVEQWGFADPASALEEARATCASVRGNR